MAGATSTAAQCGTAEVKDIFAGNCNQGPCHDATTPAANLDLTVNDPAAAFSGQTSDLCTNSIILDPGSPETSLLWTKLVDKTPTCGDQMPLGSTITTAEQDCIASWISSLALVGCEMCGGASCLDLQTDSAHCGSCDVACQPGQVCVDGGCSGCENGTSACGTTCVDLTTSNGNCGACGNSCGPGRTCVDSQCQCDAGVSVSFANDVAPLLDSQCGTAACHAGRKPKEGLDLQTATSFSAMVGVETSECADGRLLVDPGNPQESYLVQKVTGIDMCFGSLMPKGAPLTDAQVSLISAWICSGAPNN
jgi:hypothetical protein